MRDTEVPCDIVIFSSVDVTFPRRAVYVAATFAKLRFFRSESTNLELGSLVEEKIGRNM